MFMKIKLIFILILISFTSFAADGLDENIDPKLYKEIAGQLRCPSCQGMSVLESDANFSVQIKDEVKRQLLQKKEKNEILRFFSERYGIWILRQPPMHGYHLIIWLLPVAFLLLGGGAIIWFFGRSKGGKRDPYESSHMTKEIVNHMKKELNKRRGQRSELRE